MSASQVPNSDGSRARCPEPCGKVRYLTRRSAKLARRRQVTNARARGSHLAVYQCKVHDQFWHLGTLPAPVVSGDISRDDIRPPA